MSAPLAITQRIRDWLNGTTYSPGHPIVDDTERRALGLGTLIDQLAALGLTETGTGTDLIGVPDANSHFTGTTLSEVLDELYDAATSAGADTFTDSAAWYTTDTINAAFAQIATWAGTKPAATATIAAGVLTLAGSVQAVDTEAAAASDDVDTIAGLADGQVGYLYIANAARNVVLKHGSGNVVCPGGFDITLDVVTDSVLVKRQGASYIVVSFGLTNLASGGLGAALNSGAATKGASMVALQDAGAYYPTDNVEAALQLRGMKDGGNVIADPGTAQPIPVTKSGTLALVIGAGAETNTLPVPTFLGQELLICVTSVGGGTRAITAASAINKAGNTITTLGNAQDSILLRAGQVAGAAAWRVVVNDGTVLS